MSEPENNESSTTVEDVIKQIGRWADIIKQTAEHILSSSTDKDDKKE